MRVLVLWEFEGEIGGGIILEMWVEHSIIEGVTGNGLGEEPGKTRVVFRLAIVLSFTWEHQTIRSRLSQLILIHAFHCGSFYRVKCLRRLSSLNRSVALVREVWNC